MVRLYRLIRELQVRQKARATPVNLMPVIPMIVIPMIFAWYLVMMIAAPPAQSQSLASRNAVLQKTITVERFTPDPDTGRMRLVARWPWVEYHAFYNNVMLLPMESLATKPDILRSDYLKITESNAKGQIEKQLILHNGQVDITYFFTFYEYFADVKNLYPALVKFASQAPKDTIKPQGLLVIHPPANDVTLALNTAPEIATIAQFLRDIPRLDETDQNAAPFPDRAGQYFTIEASAKLADWPPIIQVAPYQIRFIRLQSRERSYRDGIGFYRAAMRQLQLAQSYQQNGVTPPRLYD